MRYNLDTINKSILSWFDNNRLIINKDKSLALDFHNKLNKHIVYPDIILKDWKITNYKIMLVYVILWTIAKLLLVIQHIIWLMPLTTHSRTYNSHFQQLRKLNTSLNTLNLLIHVDMMKFPLNNLKSALPILPHLWTIYVIHPFYQRPSLIA